MSTDDITPTPSVDNVERLPSLDALQTAHKELLQAHRQEGDTPEMLDRVEAFIYQGQATGAVLDAEDDRWTAQGMLDYWSATLFRAARRAPDATLADFDPSLAPELRDELCPYVGLDSFREATQAAFFGRERLVATLVEKLADSRLLVVSGPSGSGKSSVVLAGLLPALRRGALPGSESWRYVPRMVPGSNPLVNLVRLIEAAGDGNQEDPVAWAQQQEKLLRENPNHLLELVNATGEAPVVGVVDQFEEAFTLCNDRQVRQAFIDNLVNLVQASGARHTVVLTMRTDFEPFVTRLPEFYALFEQALVRVTPLSASELREAIEKPAGKIGLKFEAGLVDQLLQDLLGEPAGLPLLQFTLLKLWENRTRNRITWAVYNRLGGGRLALARSADAFYDELIPEEQVTAKRILLRLVRPGEGLEFTSNRVRLRTLYQAGEAPYRVDQVLDKLIAAHLLRVSEGDVAADTQVEVAHEALVRNWPRLVDWLEEERHNIRRRQGVSDAAERWIASGRDPGALYTTETVVQEALRVVEASGVALNEQEGEFIRASQDAQEAARNEKAAAKSGIRRVKVALAIVVLVAILASILAFLAAEAARQNKAAVMAQQTAVAAQKTAVTQREAAVVAEATAAAAVLQREAEFAARTTAEAGATQVAANLRIAQDALDAQIGLIDQVATAEAEKAVLSAQVQALETVLTTTASPSAPVPTVTPTTPGSETGPPTPARTTSGTRTATPSSTTTPTRTTTPTPTRTPGSADVQSATAAAVALATLRSQVQETQTVIAAINTGQQKPAIVQPGQIVFTCFIDGFDQICIMDADGTNQLQLTNDKATSFYPSLSLPDGDTVVYSSSRENSGAGLFQLFEMTTTGSDPRVLKKMTGQLYAPAVSPDGDRVVFTREVAGSLNIWVMNRDGTEAVPLTNTSGSNLDPVWSPDGTQIAFASDRSGKMEYYIMNADGSSVQMLKTEIDNIGGRSDWSSDDKWLAFYAGLRGNRNIFIVATDGSDVVRQLTNRGDNTGPSFSPDGKWLTFQSYRDGDQEIFIMDIDGNNVTQITKNNRADYQPRWGP